MVKNKHLENELVKRGKLLLEKEEEIKKLKKLNSSRKELLVEQVHEVQQIVVERDSRIIALSEANKSLLLRMQNLEKSFVDLNRLH